MENSNQQAKEYALWNATDKIFAAPDRFKSVAEAEDFARMFRKRFSTQGYYLTADGYRIAPEDIRLEVVPAKP